MHRDAHAACPLCARQAIRSVRRFRSQHLVRCLRCGFRFSDRIPTPAELAAYYGTYPIKPADPITRARYREVLGAFERERRTGRLLDVGCGSGDFLAEAAALGWAVHGTEYGDNFVAACRARGIAMHQGALRADAFGGSRFDVITSLEVIEHLTHPHELIAQMVELLRPGGLLYLTTPNYNSISRLLAGSGWDVVNYPEHVSYFTPRTMHRLLTGHGLRRERIRTTGVSITRIRTSHRPDGRLRSLPYDDDQALRRAFEASPAMGMVKRLINGGLDLLKVGDTLKVTYRAPGP